MDIYASKGIDEFLVNITDGTEKICKMIDFVDCSERNNFQNNNI